MEQGTKPFRQLLQEKLFKRNNIKNDESKTNDDDPKLSEVELGVLCRELEEKITRYSSNLDKIYRVYSSDLNNVTNIDDLQNLRNDFQAVYSKIGDAYKKAVEDYSSYALKYSNIDDIIHKREIFSIDKSNTYYLNMKNQFNKMDNLVNGFSSKSIETIAGSSTKQDTISTFTTYIENENRKKEENRVSTEVDKIIKILKKENPDLDQKQILDIGHDYYKLIKSGMSAEEAYIAKKEKGEDPKDEIPYYY